MMIKLLEIQKTLVPQVVEMMERRYVVLRQISISQPIGRRNLSTSLGISERVVRAETDFLREKGLISVEVSGMKLTEFGESILEDVKSIMEDVLEISTLEKKVQETLGITKVIVAPGDFNENNTLLKEVANYAAGYFLSILKDNDVISVTGGTTMRAFADAVKSNKHYDGLTVVPARGSFGFDVETQSNSIASSLSKSLKSKLELLTIPDELEDEAMESLMKVPGIRSAIEAVKRTDVLVFSVGRADVMADRRDLPDDIKDKLDEKNAVGEAFGYYFDKDGNIVHKLSTVGIDLETYSNIENSILVFAGDDKVDAFLSVISLNKNVVLVTDEASAREILKKTVNN